MIKVKTTAVRYPNTEEPVIESTGTFTMTTCSDACWYAREDTCRCQCGGANHGILRDGDGEQPARTRLVGQDRFTLVAVIPGYRPAATYVRGLYEELGERCPFSYAIKPSFGPTPRFAITTASQAQVRGWVELEGFRGWEERGRCMAEARRHQPMLVWRKHDGE